LAKILHPKIFEDLDAPLNSFTKIAY
jgi:hypothetical protein